MVLLIKILPLGFLGVSQKKMLFFLVIFNEVAVDIIRSTQHCIEYINRAVLANLQCRTLQLGRLIALQETPIDIKNSIPMATHSFPVYTHLISIC